MEIDIAMKPELDPGFVPAAAWNRAYDRLCDNTAGCTDLGVAVARPDGTTFVRRTRVLPHVGDNVALNTTRVERFVKTMLWLHGGSRILIAGHAELAAHIARIYAPDGTRAFDYDLMGARMFLEPMTVSSCTMQDLPEPCDAALELGRHTDGCRIGFDLGGSDRKAAAVVDGEVVFSEEIEWDPYFEANPEYHYNGIQDSLKRAAAHLPRIDAIGGSAAGDYVNNEPRVASLFRGVADADFDKHVRGMFHRIQAEWGGVPFVVANDGEVTALAGSMSLHENGVLGVAMGTSLAAGYCNMEGRITCWLNELAFSPIDYRADGPADEWSGDVGCGVQYLSQQAVARLVPQAGIDLPADMPFAEQLKEVQKLMASGDARARRIYETIGVYLGYAVMAYAEFYTIRHLLLLGRVTSGTGGTIIVQKAREVLAAERPDLGDAINITMPDEKLKRHGQAIAAASLPAISRPPEE